MEFPVIVIHDGIYIEIHNEERTLWSITKAHYQKKAFKNTQIYDSNLQLHLVEGIELKAESFTGDWRPWLLKVFNPAYRIKPLAIHSSSYCIRDLRTILMQTLKGNCEMYDADGQLENHLASLGKATSFLELVQLLEANFGVSNFWVCPLPS